MTKQFFVMALILVSMIGAGAVGSVAAEPPASPPAGGVPQLGEQILQAIQNLQNTVNTLQQTVRTLQTQVGQFSTNPQTSYYLTKGTFAGDQILSPPAATPACDPGFHFASFLEIIDVSNLKYDTARGRTGDDSGSGPPVFTNGWVRSGGGPGETAECRTWTSHSAGDSGQTNRLIADHPNAPWITPPQLFGCNLAVPVWCVQD